MPVGFEPTNKGFADLPLKPLGYSTNFVNYLKLHCKKEIPLAIGISRAGNGTRTRDINLGKVALYQLSYSRISKFIRTILFIFLSEPATSTLVPIYRDALPTACPDAFYREAIPAFQNLLEQFLRGKYNIVANANQL